MLFGVSLFAAKPFRSVISAGWQYAMSVRLISPSRVSLFVTASFFIFFLNICRSASSRSVSGVVTWSGVDMILVTLVFSGFLASTITRFRRSLSVIIPMALPFLRVIRQLIWFLSMMAAASLTVAFSSMVMISLVITSATLSVTLFCSEFGSDMEVSCVFTCDSNI
jgi:hypothetical protein